MNNNISIHGEMQSHSITIYNTVNNQAPTNNSGHADEIVDDDAVAMQFDFYSSDDINRLNNEVNEDVDKLTSILDEEPGFLYSLTTGLVIIVSNKNFEDNTRDGTEFDVEVITSFFEDTLKWQVKLFKDLTSSKMIRTMNSVAKMKTFPFSCLFVFILSHGSQDGILGVDNKAVSPEKLFECFSTDKAPAFAGKPKIFVIQACRGNKDDIVKDSQRFQQPNVFEENMPPLNDFAIFYPCVKGFTALRRPSGTWFIQMLVSKLREYHHHEDLLCIFNRVCNQVASLEYQGCGRMFVFNFDSAFDVERRNEERISEYNTVVNKRGEMSFYYSMVTGYVLIIENTSYPGRENRSGSDSDVREIKRFFQGFLRWRVKECTDLSSVEMLRLFETLSKERTFPYSCLFVFILSHGRQDGILGVDNKAVSPEKLLECFSTDKAPAFAGKPKIFAIQACRGEKEEVVKDGESNERDVPRKPRHPLMSDFLIAYPCPVGYVAWRNIETGSWFIQTFISVLEKHYRHENILQLFNRVFYEVSKINANGNIERPVLISALSKSCFFQAYFTRDSLLITNQEQLLHIYNGYTMTGNN